MSRSFLSSLALLFLSLPALPVRGSSDPAALLRAITESRLDPERAVSLDRAELKAGPAEAALLDRPARQPDAAARQRAEALWDAWRKSREREISHIDRALLLEALQDPLGTGFSGGAEEGLPAGSGHVRAGGPARPRRASDWALKRELPYTLSVPKELWSCISESLCLRLS